MRSNVRTLAIQRRWIVVGPKNIQQILIFHLRWIEFDFHHFDVAIVGARRSISRAISRVRRRRPGTATRLIAGRGWGMGQLLRGGADLHRIGAVALAERSGIDLLQLDLAR